MNKYSVATAMFAVLAIATGAASFARRDKHGIQIAGVVEQVTSKKAATRGGDYVPTKGTSASDSASQSRTPTPPQLPPKGTPWTLLRDQLMPRAASGDREARFRLAREALRCEGRLRSKGSLALELRTPLAADSDEQQIAFHQMILENATANLEKEDGTCAELTDELLAKDVYRVLLLAADAGDSNAAACYIGAWFGIDKSIPRATFMETYRREGPRLAEAEIKRGNWIVVSLLAGAYSGELNGHTVRAFMVDRDQKKSYGYTKLERLGASGESALQLDRQIEAILSAWNLPPTDIAQADAWAADTYRAYFSNTPRPEDPNLCVTPE